MQCPHCRVPLAIAERQGIEVDYCPQCRGVWLDRGELDKIIDRSARHIEPEPTAPTAWGSPPRKEEYRGHYGHKQHKRKSFLHDIFDF